jgi:hypothetical protein
MPLMNFSELQDARTIRFLHKYSGGMGLAAFQFALGAAVAIALVVVFAIINVVIHGLLFPYGVGIGVACGVLAARESNNVNTRHKLANRHFQGEARKRLYRNRPLILDDQRFAYPGSETESYVVHVAEFPPPTQEQEDNNG